MTLYGFKSREVRDALINVGEGTAGLPDIPIPSREEFRPHKAKILTAVASSTITPSRLNEDETELLAGQGEVCIVTRNKNQDPGTWSPRLNAEGEPLLIPVYNFSNRIHLVEQVLKAGDVVNVDTALVRVVQDTYGNWYVLENDPRPFLVHAEEVIPFGSPGRCTALAGTLRSPYISRNAKEIIGVNAFKRPRINQGDECLAIYSQTEGESGYLLITYFSEGQGSSQTVACNNAQSSTYAKSVPVHFDFANLDVNREPDPAGFFYWDQFSRETNRTLLTIVDGVHNLDQEPDVTGFAYEGTGGLGSLWQDEGGIQDCNRWKNLIIQLPDTRGTLHQFDINLFLTVDSSQIRAAYRIYQTNLESRQQNLVAGATVKYDKTSPDMTLRWTLSRGDLGPAFNPYLAIVNPEAETQGV